MRLARPTLVGVLFALVLSLPILAGACGSADSPAASGGESVTDQKRAPAFSGSTIDGQQVSLGGFAGKPTILVFWASW